MEMKVCKICGIEKEISEYYKRTDSKDGYRYECKKCTSINRKQYREDNKKYIKEWRKVYYEDNKEKNREYGIKYYENNKERNRERKKIYYENNKEKIKERKKIYYEDNKEINKERRKKYFKEYRENNKEKIKERNKKYNKNNRNYYNEYTKERRRIDPLYRLKGSLRASIAGKLRIRGYIKKSITFEILGCDYETVKRHLEYQFEPWMSWENYGKYNGEYNYGWDVDHIIPQAVANTEEELIKLNHYTNLQPLCSKVNRDIKRGYYEPLCITDCG